MRGIATTRMATTVALVLVLGSTSACTNCPPSGCEAPCEGRSYSFESGTSTNPCYDDLNPNGRLPQEWIADLRSGDRAARDRAVDALARMGPSVLPQVGPLLSDEDAGVRFTAMQVFVRLRHHAWSSVWYVRNRLTDSDPAIRADAAYVVGMAGPDAAEAIPELIGALDDHSPYVRYRAAVAFQRMGERGEPGLAAIRRVSRCDREERVREAATCALGRIESALRIKKP